MHWLPGCLLAAAAPHVVSIMEIQGVGATSPFEGELVETTGVVTQVTPDGWSFWLQDPVGDGDLATSDGLFVFAGRGSVVPGDFVRVVDRVREHRGRAGELSLSELSFPHEVEVLSRGWPLPEPVEIRDLPDVSVEAAISLWERLEGMRVRLRAARVVAPTNRFGEIVVLARGDARRGSGFEPRSGLVFLGPLDYNPERITVEDVGEALRPGDRVPSVVGAVDYAFGTYRIRASELDVKTRKPARVKRPRARRDLSVASWNLENLFDLVDQPGKIDVGTGGASDAEALEVQLEKLSAGIAEELRTPELVVVQEVENRGILQTLAGRVNARAGTRYDGVSFESSDRRGIEVGLLWDADRVTLLDARPLAGADVEAAFGKSSGSPGREPLVARVRVGDDLLTLVGVHFKSKLGDDPVFGEVQPFRRPTEAQRSLQARVVRDFVADLLARESDALLLVLGDLNDFQFAEPGEDAAHPAGILEERLTNLVHHVRRSERYSFLFQGNAQVLDHAFASPAMLERVREVRFLHFNAAFPDALHDDPSAALRASDHDPLWLRFR